MEGIKFSSDLSDFDAVAFENIASEFVVSWKHHPKEVTASVPETACMCVACYKIRLYLVSHSKSNYLFFRML